MAQVDDSRVKEIAEKFALLAPTIDEGQTRLWLVAEAKALGRGGIAAVTRATGVLGKRIWMGLQELAQIALQPNEEPARSQRIRRPGGGRKKLTETDETLVEDLESLIAPETRGDPESPLRWTTKSVRKLAEQLTEMGHEIGRQKVSELLHELGYSLQGLNKRREGADQLFLVRLAVPYSAHRPQEPSSCATRMSTSNKNKNKKLTRLTPQTNYRM